MHACMHAVCLHAYTTILTIFNYECAGGQGKRSDLADACAMIKEGKSDRDVALACPETWARYNQGLKRVREAIKEPLRDEEFQPRPWQHRVLTVLAAAANDRTITWVYETVGNVGKSRLVRHLLLEKQGIFLTGKLADMCHAYTGQPIVCFDITRAQAEFSDNVYTMSEQLKNGYIFKSKYESQVFTFKTPHVIVFANFPPTEGKWSADRVTLMDLEQPEFHQEAIREFAVPAARRGRFSNNGRIARAAAE